MRLIGALVLFVGLCSAQQDPGDYLESVETVVGSMVESVQERALMERLMKPFRWEDLQMFSDSPENYATSDSPDDVLFFLYSNPQDPTEFQRISWNDKEALRELPWNRNAPIKILMHGFTQSQNSSMPAMIKDAYLEAARENFQDVNVISVDWGCLGGSTKASFVPIYTRAVRNVETAGVRVGELVANLLRFGVIDDLSQIHLIGFSLGAHVAGWAGHTAKRLTGSKVARVTGLDPAGPLFYANIKNFSGRDLSKDDGIAVDVLHTSYGTYGKAATLGHADFFANYANIIPQVQPYCLRMIKSKRPVQVCSHNLATVFFSMSILRDMQACKCPLGLRTILCRKTCRNSALFGEQWDQIQHGTFFLDIPKKLFLEDPEEDDDSDTEESEEVAITRGDRIRNQRRREQTNSLRPNRY